MTLGEIIELLEMLDPDVVFGEGFSTPHSWRGDYSEIAFEPATNVTAGSMLMHARSAVGKTFEGYKGDKYVMSLGTPCNIDSFGAYSGDNARLTTWLWKHMVSTIKQTHRKLAQEERHAKAV